MSQNDYTIANQTAPNLRSDLNNALQALASQSSGTTAPSTTYANQIWYDTANNILKMRNEANDDWINLFTITQSTGTSFPSEVPRVIDEDSFASNNATRPPSQQSTKAYVDGLALGVGQTWQDVTSSRQNDTTYQNTEGRPICVSIIQTNRSNGNSIAKLFLNGSLVSSVNDFESSGLREGTMFAVIPSGDTYEVTGNREMFAWWELK